jgi:hypothetical protein
MKTKFTCLATLWVMLLFTNCKKDKPVFESNAPTPTAELSLATASVASIGVETVYGTPYATGALVDGNGASARFNAPSGIVLMPNGNLYVADRGNNVIRKIVPEGSVSTVQLKPATSGAVLAKPVYLGVEHKTGTFHIVQDGNADFDAYDQSWIFKSNGDFVATDYSYYVNATAMARDPYTDTFYYSPGNGITQHVAQPGGGIYGQSVNYDLEKLLPPLLDDLFHGNDLVDVRTGFAVKVHAEIVILILLVNSAFQFN